MSRPVGRPSLSAEVVALIRELRATGMGYTVIADKLAIGRTTVRRYLGTTSRGDEGLYSSEGRG